MTDLCVETQGKVPIEPRNPGSKGLPGGQGHDAPLLPVGTYARPSAGPDVAAIVHGDNDGQADTAVTGPKSNSLPPYLG